MPKTIEKLELLLQNNAKSSEKMCRFYCVLLLKTHMNYLGKIILIDTFSQLKSLINDYTIIIS